MTSPASQSPTVALGAVLVIVIAGLWSLDVFLARTDREAVQNQAGSLHAEGIRLLQHGDARDAADRLRRANSLERENRAYQLDYVSALVSAGKFDQAETNLKTLLQADPNNGPANLVAARLMAQESKISDAESHYHRAIYGSWPDHAPARRLAARLELAHLLLSRGEQPELLSELLAIESEAHSNNAILEQTAHLYLAAGSPTHAANVYRELIELNPDSLDAYAGLGDAELAQGDYRAALAAFLNANRRKPGNPAIQHGIALSNEMATLDPTPRRISSVEKFARSTHILQLAYDSFSRCTSRGDAKGLMAAGAAELAKKAPPHVTNELAEARLALAEQLWEARIKTCGPSKSGEEQALRLIMTKLAHS